jgi:L-idonate 5-dehydrogenase
LIGTRRVNLSGLITATLPYAQAVEAFDLAGDKSRSMKVQLAFNG